MYPTTHGPQNQALLRKNVHTNTTQTTLRDPVAPDPKTPTLPTDRPTDQPYPTCTRLQNITRWTDQLTDQTHPILPNPTQPNPTEPKTQPNPNPTNRPTDRSNPPYAQPNSTRPQNTTRRTDRPNLPYPTQPNSIQTRPTDGPNPPYSTQPNPTQPTTQPQAERSKIPTQPTHPTHPSLPNPTNSLFDPNPTNPTSPPIPPNQTQPTQHHATQPRLHKPQQSISLNPNQRPQPKTPTQANSAHPTTAGEDEPHHTRASTQKTTLKTRVQHEVGVARRGGCEATRPFCVRCTGRGGVASTTAHPWLRETIVAQRRPGASGWNDT